MSRLFPSLACVSSMVVAVTLAGCAASDETDDSATGASSAYSNDPAADLDVPRFPKDSLAGRGNARMTVAYGDGAFESFDEGEARVVIALEPERWPHRLAMPKVDLALLFLTAVLTVLVDLTVAIAAGTLIGLIVKRWMRPPAASPDSRPEG